MSYLSRLRAAVLAPEPDPTIAAQLEERAGTVPVIWLLGKTGAGKSSLVRALTGLTAAEIGNGFSPCTRTAEAYDHPPEAPVLRFLDTRGLGEAGYDPGEDLTECRARSHAVLAAARLDDPAQAPLEETLREIVRRDKGVPVILVHTGAGRVPDAERARARALMQARMEAAAGRTLPAVEVDLAPLRRDPGADCPGVETLRAALAEALPEAALAIEGRHDQAGERGAFERLRGTVLWHARAAGGTDLAPLVGAVTVPAIQGQMLRVLAARYGVEWTRGRLAGLAAALGMGTLVRIGAGLAARQAAKLIPVFGQTVGAAASGAISYATTYALGRAAAYYLFRLRRGEPVSREELRALYREALRRAGAADAR